MIEFKASLLYLLFIFVSAFIWIETKHSTKTYIDVSPEMKAEELYIDEKIIFAESALDTLQTELNEIEKDVPNKRK